MPSKYSSYESREKRAQSVRHIEKMLADPVLSRALRHKDKILSQHKRDKALLDKVTPPPIASDDERKALINRCQKLEEAMILGTSDGRIDAMPDKIEMWERPAGAVGKHTRWENTWKNYTLSPDGKKLVKDTNGRGAILEWKDHRRRIFSDREPEDPDVANIETFRPDATDQAGFISRRRKSYSLLSSLSYEQYDALFPDHQPTDVEIKLRTLEEIQRPEFNVDHVLVEKFSGDPPQRCKAKNQNGTQCKRYARHNSVYCNHPRHQALQGT